MDNSRLDLLAKTAAGGSRRSLLKATIGAAFGGIFGAAGLKSTSAARKRGNGAVCRANSDCESDYCNIWDIKDSRGTCEKFCDYGFNGFEPI